MTARHDLAATLPWMRQGTAHLLACADDLSDTETRAPSALPGWSRAHVAGHLARNAEALGRLAAWARTGVETPMYSGPEQRATEIEESAGRTAAVLRSELAATAAALEDALAGLGENTWGATVRSAQGRQIPAAEIPWMRIREVWIHAVDLGTGASFGDLPDGVVDLLLDDVTGVLSARDNCPAAVLRPSDRDREWQLGAGEDGSAALVTAPAADLAGWLTGRVRLPGEVPALPRWL